jgi:ribosomal protein S18 acetylase RimI-like enzyme
MARKHTSAGNRPIIAGYNTTTGGDTMAFCPENAASDNGKGEAGRFDADPARLVGPEEDWTQLMVVLRESFAGMTGRIDPPSSLDRLTVADLAEIAKTAEIWVIGSPITATVTLTMRPDCLYLGKLAVAAHQRGQGLARRLIMLAEARAQVLGLAQVMLETRVELVENQALFRHLGFVETCRRRHPGFDRDTTVEFRKSVG